MGVWVYFNTPCKEGNGAIQVLLVVAALAVFPATERKEREVPSALPAPSAVQEQSTPPCIDTGNRHCHTLPESLSKMTHNHQ